MAMNVRVNVEVVVMVQYVITSQAIVLQAAVMVGQGSRVYKVTFSINIRTSVTVGPVVRNPDSIVCTEKCTDQPADTLL